MQHFTKGTLGAPKWCNTCKTFTTHRVDNGRLTRICIPCQEKAEVERLARPKSEPPAHQEGFDFAGVLTK